MTEEDGWEDGKTLPIPYDSREWGALYGWKEPLSGVYHLSREYGELYLADRARAPLPQGIYPYGVTAEDERYVYFDCSNGVFVLEYELNLFKLKTAGADRAALEEKLVLASIMGSGDNPDYFGPLVPKDQTMWGRRNRYLTVDNGIWLVQFNGRWFLEVSYFHNFLLCDFLMDPGRGKASGSPGKERKDWFWTTEYCAPVLYRLLEGGRTEVAQLITSMDDLCCNLTECFPEFTTWHNEKVNWTIDLVRRHDPKAEVGRLEEMLIVKRPGSTKDCLRLPI